MLLEVLSFHLLIAALPSHNLLLRLELVQVYTVIFVAIPPVEEALTVLGIAIAASDGVLVMFEFKQTLSDFQITTTASEAETSSSYVMCAA